MLEGSRIAVVVPAFNEERWIAETVRGVPAFVDDIIVVDDASGDGTARAAEAAFDPRVRVIRHPHNRGVGAAIVTGYKAARADGAEAIAVMAGDGQMSPNDLPRVVSPVVRGDAEYVKGDRLRAAGVLRVMPLHRLAGTAALAYLTRIAAGLPALSDSQCGYTAIAGWVIDALGEDLDALWPRYGYPNDLIGLLARRGLRIHEVMVEPVYRGEASGLRPWHLVTIGYLIGRAAYRRARGG